MKDSVENEELVLDTSGTECPIPVLKARKLASELNKDTIIKIIATDPLAEADFEHYCDQSNYEYLSCKKIKDMLNYKAHKNSWTWDNISKKDFLISENIKLNEPILLFSKIEDFEIQKQIDKLNNN